MATTHELRRTTKSFGYAESANSVSYAEAADDCARNAEEDVASSYAAEESEISASDAEEAEMSASAAEDESDRDPPTKKRKLNTSRMLVVQRPIARLR